MIVVPVLITSCQVSEYPNAGPDMAHISTTKMARQKAVDEPADFVACAARWSKRRAIREPDFSEGPDFLPD